MAMKAVIPAAGLGTRMLPAAKAVPKEMLPILNKPAIQYVVEEAVRAGVRDVLLIVSRQKRAIEDHFDSYPELEARLDRNDRRLLLASVDELSERALIYAVRQRKAQGLGHAVLQARHHVGNEPFLCMLGDTVFDGDLLPAEQLRDAYARLGTAIVGLEEVPTDKLGRYGVVAGRWIDRQVMSIDSLVEKPAPEASPSRFAVAARYVLTPDIFDCLEHTGCGKGGEIQLTDALGLLLKRQPVHGVLLAGRRHDIGGLEDWLRANLLFARRDERLWSELAPWLRALLIDGEGQQY